MARIRSIKPDSCTDERLADCSTTARLLFVQMQCFCDDGGVHPARARTLKAEVFPMDDFSADQVSAWIAELINVGLLAEFKADGQEFWLVNDWSSLQKIEKPSFKYPRPNATNSTTPHPAVADESASGRRIVDDGSPAEGKGKEGEEGRSSTVVALSPSKSLRKHALPEGFVISERVREWATENGFADYLELHFEYMVGTVKASGTKYIDWDQTLMNYVRNDYGDVRKKALAAGGANGGSLFAGAR